MCVWLPNFPIQHACCRHPELKSAAFGIYAQSGNRARIVAASREAMRQGIQPGTPLAEAQSLLDSAEFILHDEQADLLELEKLARACHLYSPHVGLEHSCRSHCLVLDITGCASLFKGEFSLAQQILIELMNRGFFAHIAAANTIGAAWGIARHGHEAGANRTLRSLPVEALRIPDQLVMQLREFDLFTIGQLTQLPKDELPSRFGSILTERLDQMLGMHEELIVPVLDPKPVSAEWSTDEPICHRKAIRSICTDLISEILDNLHPQGEGLQRLTATLQSEASDPVVLEIGLTRPVDSLPHVMDLVDLKIETEPIPEWLVGIRLEASATAPLHLRQGTLFTHTPDQELIRNDDSIERLIDRLTARLGAEAVVRPRLLPEALPEKAVRFESFSNSASEKKTTIVDSPGHGPTRPLELFPEPQPIEVISITPDGSPVRFYWKNRTCEVTHCTEPERIQTGWWQDNGCCRRDYYRVETRTGSRFWLFRNGNTSWFLHGVFE
ncbi:MAG: DNA polymerase Y family protein [Fuerstiella sp.]|nr:DNA polymerase Y family protein [Fuerstiella sp.]